MTIVATNSVDGFFEEVLGDAMRHKNVSATEGATRYLVGLLTDYTKPEGLAEETLERPLAFLLDEAIHTPDAARRFEKLRSLGDGVLYSCGFFRDHFEARGVDAGYVIGIGTTAYGRAGSLLRFGGEDDATGGMFDLFGELARKFLLFVEVLTDVAESTMVTDGSTPKQLVKMYERWLKTGSSRLAENLSSHGLVPTRGPKGGTLQ